MKPLDLVTLLTSTLFRLFTYLFLRVFPGAILKKIVPTLFAIYLSSVYFGSRSSSEPSDDKPPPIPEKDVQNGVVVHTKFPSKTKNSFSRNIVSILFSLPSPSRILTLTNLTINILLMLMAAEFVFYPLFDDAKDVQFTRVGAVYPDSVKIALRYPASGNATAHSLHVLWRQTTATDTTWSSGPTANLTQENDWTATVRLTGLWPKTSYEYILEDADNTRTPYPKEPIKFKTFSDPHLSHSGSYFRFVVTSCSTPNFPYLPLHGRRIKGFDLLADYLWPVTSTPTPPPPSTSLVTSDTAVPSGNSTDSTITNVTSEKAETEFFLFLGDFIYADVPMYFGDDQEAYRRLYRRNYQSPSFRRIYERLPVFHTYDDHEIINNYVGQGNDSTYPFQNASSAYKLYNAEANFDSQAGKDINYYNFRYGDAAFFVMDTRRYRSDINTDLTTQTMLGEEQLTALHHWLGEVNSTATFKFIVSSVPFTDLWQYEALVDCWPAYPAEKAALLSAMHSVPNVIILSGDRHEFAAIEYMSEGLGNKVLEISTSPLSMFYVPLIRTLNMQSEATVRHRVSRDSNETIEVPQERVLKYIPVGNHKWSSLEVDTRNRSSPTIHLETVADGEVVYRLSIAGQPVALRSSTALGGIMPTTFKGILDRIGLSPSHWF
ncbi:hypothetical protein ABKN59_008654 [Abortiporus biennis]